MATLQEKLEGYTVEQKKEGLEAFLYKIREAKERAPFLLPSRSYRVASSYIRLFLENDSPLPSERDYRWMVEIALRALDKDILHVYHDKGITFSGKSVPFHLVASYGNTLEEQIDIINFFLEHGMNIDEKDPMAGDSTLLHLVVSMNSDDNAPPFIENVIQYLFERGAEPNLPNAEGETPIFNLGLLPVLPLFIENGADLNHVDNRGRTFFSGWLMGLWTLIKEEERNGSSRIEIEAIRESYERYFLQSLEIIKAHDFNPFTPYEYGKGSYRSLASRIGFVELVHALEAYEQEYRARHPNQVENRLPRRAPPPRRVQQTQQRMKKRRNTHKRKNGGKRRTHYRRKST